MTEVSPYDPIFELSDVVDFSGVDPRRIQVWIQRGIIETQHKPEGKGDVRKYTLSEMVRVQMVASMADNHGLKPNAYKELAKTASLIVTDSHATVEDGRWATGRPDSKEVQIFKDDATLPLVREVVGAGCFVVFDLLPYFETLVPAAIMLGQLILMRKQLARQRS